MFDQFKTMLKYNQELVRWWVFACAMMTLSTGVMLTGGYTFINNNDFTGISWGIIVILFSGTLYYGFRLARDENLGQGVMEYLADLCTGLGLLGTIIGLMTMIGGAFEGINPEDPASVKMALIWILY